MTTGLVIDPDKLLPALRAIRRMPRGARILARAPTARRLLIAADGYRRPRNDRRPRTCRPRTRRIQARPAQANAPPDRPERSKTARLAGCPRPQTASIGQAYARRAREATCAAVGCCQAFSVLLLEPAECLADRR